jgi:Xaa-Pro aminopeptidase
MTGRPPLILYSGGSGDADFYYACGVEVEQALYLRFGEGEGDDLLVVSRLELERAQQETRAARVADRGEFGWTERQDPLESWGELAVRLLRDRGATAAVSSPRLFAALYRSLTAAGLDVELDHRLFLEERRRKSDLEGAAIRAAQRAAEAACVEVIRSLAAATPGAGGALELEGRPLTSEMLMARAQFVLNEHGHSTPELIIAGSPECALPHFRGAGPIRSGAPVIIDIFPRGNASHFHGDLTRTVVPGPVPDAFRRMHDASVAALEAAIANLRAGADGREVHRTACRALVEHGYGTVTAGFEGDPQGPRMTHSTGHGVGLEVHEAPQLRDLVYPLVEGDVVTVEPGLYQVGLGGVRVEDTGMVTAGGFDDFTTLPRSLDPRAYL